LEEKLATQFYKIHQEYYCLKTSLCDEVMLVLCGDCVHCVYSFLDASVAEEDIEGEFYQEEEEYPGHFANQGKPSFESYSTCLVLLLHSTCFK
jgi:hypothetical protein